MLTLLPPQVRRLVPPVVVRNVDFLDVCAGRARPTKWAIMMGLSSIASDSEYGPHMDITTDEGLALLVTCVCRTARGGLMLMGPKCSSWVWVCRFSSQRSVENPLGDATRDFVRQGNCLNACCSLVCRIAWALGVSWVIEQPSSSLFFATPLMQAVVADCQARRIAFPMSNFGHPACKQTVLVGTASWLPTFCGGVAGLEPAVEAPAVRRAPKSKAKAALVRPAPKAKAKVGLVRRLGVQSGQQRVRGIPELSASQVYPARFALAIVRAHWPERVP